MSRLYPPIINGTIPAFYGATLVVPFSLNRAVSSADIRGIRIKIKTTTGILKENIDASLFDASSEYYARFDITPEYYTLGQFYKVQIAFVDSKGDAGYYSDVGITKYTAKPTVYIENLIFGEINSHQYDYTGVYSQEGGDPTEKLYSTRFRIYDNKENLIDDTGDIIHNITKDNLTYEAHETYQFLQELEDNNTYYIKFSATTVNGLEISTPSYRITRQRSVNPEVKFDFKAALNNSNGYIELTLENSSAELISGAFLITRTSSKDKGWVEIKRFSVTTMPPSEFSYQDCTVEHGVKYKYSIQQYNNNGLYSERILSNSVTAEFYDTFLFDGEKQLCIRYNPQVSSFKTTHAEQTITTMGNQYPYILRSGKTKYKEFPIGGLISYKMDEDNEMFISFDELGIVNNTTSLTFDNITAERLFKMEVLDWLNNGKPKVFRSPTEGNFLVRLMNVSLSPQVALGRMLHSFSATAYEIAEFSIKNLEAYGIITATEAVRDTVLWETVRFIDLAKKDPTLLKQSKKIRINPTYLAYEVLFTDCMPGTEIWLDNEKIVIGATGSYKAVSNVGFQLVEVNSAYIYQGMCTYQYKDKSASVSMFGTIDNLVSEDIPVRQFIGTYELVGSTDIFGFLENSCTEVSYVGLARFVKRPISYLYVNVQLSDGEISFPEIMAEASGNELGLLYYDMDCKDKVLSFKDLDPLTTYQLRIKRGDYRDIFNEGYYIDRNTTVFAPYVGYYLDGAYAAFDGVYKIFPIEKEMYNIQIGDDIINIEEEEKYKLSSPNNFKFIAPSNGVITDLGYSTQNIEYSFCRTDENVQKAKKQYEDSLKELQEFIINFDLDYSTVETKRTITQALYRNYIMKVDKAIEEYKEVYGKI